MLAVVDRGALLPPEGHFGLWATLTEEGSGRPQEEGGSRDGAGVQSAPPPKIFNVRAPPPPTPLAHQLPAPPPPPPFPRPNNCPTSVTNPHPPPPPLPRKIFGRAGPAAYSVQLGHPALPAAAAAARRRSGGGGGGGGGSGGVASLAKLRSGSEMRGAGVGRSAVECPPTPPPPSHPCRSLSP